MAAYDDLNVKRIFTVGILSIVVTGVTALAVQVLYYNMLSWQQAETEAASDYRRQNAILAEQTKEISSYGVNEDNGNVIVPVDQVIDYLVKEKSKSAGNAKDNGSDET